MKIRALIVDDDETIREAVGDIVALLGHEYECAGCQNTARELLSAKEFSYVLLDLEVPVRNDGGFPRTENGENLLEQIHRRPATADVPVIVMTAHGKDGPNLGVKQMKLGAKDFVTKPFDNGALDTAIRDALAARRYLNGQSPHVVVEPKLNGPPRPFEGGLLTLHERHAELCGVTILEKNGRGHAWRVLGLLAQKNDAGNCRPLSGQQLAGELGRRVAQNAVSQCIRSLRKRITKTLREQMNIECDDRDVIQSGGPGYRLNPRIEVRQDDDPGSTPNNDPGDTGGVTQDDPGVMCGVSGVNDRQQWILDQLRAGAKLQRVDVKQKFKCSATTSKRDLAELRKSGLTEFVPKPSPGHYRLVDRDQADLQAISAS